MDIEQLANAGNEPVSADVVSDEPIVDEQTPTPEPQPEETEQPLPEAAVAEEEHEDQIPHDADENSMRAWIGRRDKRLRDEYDTKLKTTVEGLVQGLSPLIQQAQQPPVQQSQIPTQPQINLNVNPEEIDFINDPVGAFTKLATAFVPQYVPQYNAQQTAQFAQKATQVINGVGVLAKNDPILKDDADKVIEIAKKLSPPNFEMTDAATATKWAFTEAQNIFLREKVTKKVNPLSANKPVTQPIGSVTPGAVKPSKPKPALSNDMLDVANKMGLTEEQAYKLLQE
jgi:hypothetical protein